MIRLPALLLPLLLAQALGTVPGAAQDPPAAAPLDEARLKQGVAASRLMDLPLVDGRGRTLGRIADVVLEARDGHFAGLIAAVPDTPSPSASPVSVPERLTIPWRAVTLADGAVTVDAPEGVGLAAYAPMAGDTALPVPGHGWTLGNLIGDYAVLRGGIGFGTVRDVVFDPADGALIAVVVDPAARFNTGKAAAYPYRAAAWTPEAGVYSLPYGEGELAAHPPFDYDSLNGADGGAD